MTTKTTIAMKVSFDFLSNNPLAEVSDVLDISGIKPLSITFNPTMYDNVTIEFDSRDDAIRFTEVYLDSEDPADILEYVV
jgi:hypothetical protein